jgi:PKHD-type hydroxylase
MSKNLRFRAGLELKSNDFLNEFIVLKNIFSPIECEKIINLKGIKDQSYITTNSGPVLNYLSRRSTTNFVKFNKHMAWIVERLSYITSEANKNLYKFNISSLNDLNVLEYKENGFVANHFDLGKNDLSLRKISLVVFLSDPKDYLGGKLVFNPPKAAFLQEKGSVILFPSYLYHEVEPVTGGRRYTLVAWACGNAFQ